MISKQAVTREPEWHTPMVRQSLCVGDLSVVLVPVCSVDRAPPLSEQCRIIPRWSALSRATSRPSGLHRIVLPRGLSIRFFHALGLCARMPLLLSAAPVSFARWWICMQCTLAVCVCFCSFPVRMTCVCQQEVLCSRSAHISPQSWTLVWVQVSQL